MNICSLALLVSPLAGIGAGTPPAITIPPVLHLNPNPDVPLVARITLATNVPTRISLLIEDGFRTLFIPDAEERLRLEHSVLVLGVHADRTNQITVIATDEDGEQTASASPVVFQTPPLPAGFPPIAVQQIDPAETEPGYTLLAPRSSAGAGFIVILDELGEVVWFHRDASGTTRLSNGNLLILRSPFYRQEIDLLGNVVQEWYATGLGGPTPPGATLVALNTFHHEFSEMPAGEDSDFLVLSNEMRVFSNYPTSYSNLSEVEPFANVIGDVVAEIKRDGTIVRTKNLLDILDPYRIGYDSLNGGWNGAYGTSTREWAHANSVVFDPRDNTYILSLRFQDCIVKIRRDTPGTGSLDDLVWILGNHDNWKKDWKPKLLQPVGDRTGSSFLQKIAYLTPLEFEWPYHQHAAVLDASGNVVCFDNGNYRASPPKPYPPFTSFYSRAVEYRIDPGRMTVEQVWAAGGRFDPDRYRIGNSPALGNAQPLEQTGNVLVNAGGSVDITTSPYTFLARLIELKRSNPPVPVLELTVRDPSPQVGWSTYRAHRLPSLYP